MEKILVGLRPFTSDPKNKPKHCSTCGSRAMLEVYFDVGDRVTTIEKYCDACSRKIA